MDEGAWINIRTGKFSWINEHASWMKNKQNADSVGLPEHVYNKIKDMHWDFNGEGRAEILATIMKAGFIRMRGHGSYWTFEFTAKTTDALWACLDFLMNFAGPMTSCRFNNLRTGESIEMSYSKFQAEMAEDTEKVMRVARILTEDEYPRKMAFLKSYSSSLLHKEDDGN